MPDTDTVSPYDDEVRDPYDDDDTKNPHEGAAPERASDKEEEVPAKPRRAARKTTRGQ